MRAADCEPSAMDPDEHRLVPVLRRLGPHVQFQAVLALWVSLLSAKVGDNVLHHIGFMREVDGFAGGVRAVAGGNRSAFANEERTERRDKQHQSERSFDIR